jgi:hypothetical protein
MSARWGRPTVLWLQDDVIHQVNAPTAHVAGEISRHPQKQPRQQLFLSIGTYRPTSKQHRTNDFAAKWLLCHQHSSLAMRKQGFQLRFDG